MRVYLYLKHFPSDGRGFNEGTSKAVHGLASGLAACGVDATVICEGASEDTLYQAQAGYQIASFASKSTKPSLKLSLNIEQYIATISTSEQSLFILNGIFHRSVYALSRLLIKHSIPYIVAPHDPYHPTIFHKNAYLKWLYWYILERRMLSQARAIQVLDKRHDEWLRRLKVLTDVVEVPNGFSIADVHPESHLSWSIDREPKLLFLGRLDAYNKGLDILLDAFAEFSAVLGCKLTIQGPDWGDRATLEAQTTRLKLSDKVTFLEPDYNLSSSSIIANYDIFCITSRFEGFSLSALEAMLAGRVLLVSEVAGIAPHVQSSGCGIVVKPESSSIKAGLTSLVQQRSQWKEMGIRGRQYVLENLDWKSIASYALEQYKLLI
ncbi:MAG: group 1 glycosyl transferase [Pseudanabaena sp.]|nr:MAG: group 1 glycosyl transferase [Pseudanabaena sp.]